jgi:hypothetical protein
VRSGDGAPPSESGTREPVEVLRAKYLDYCSAQVAEILLLLSPDEMFVLAQDAAREAGVSGDLGYDQIVSLATGRVSRKLALPSFEDWVQEYQDDPGRFDEELMGLWESDITDQGDKGTR